MNATNPFPKARSEDIVSQQAGDELLVFDKKFHHAHCLNKLAGLVWRHCDGQRSVADLAGIVHEQLKIPADAQLIELALDELARVQLLEGFVPASPEAKQYSRRGLARRLGVGAAAALLLSPLVVSLATASLEKTGSPAPVFDSVPG